jgi:hypothetical protein
MTKAGSASLNASLRGSERMSEQMKQEGKVKALFAELDSAFECIKRHLPSGPRRASEGS